MNKEIILKLLNRIEFWIILFFLIRMVGITNPPIEIGHSWRQVTGLMVTRNFLEVDANILYPRVDDNQGATGIIGMEFPLLNYLYFLIAKIFGYAHWYGRLINLIVTSIGILFFYKIVKKYFSQKHAFVSALCLLCSIWFAFSRKMMPDTFCISLMFTGIYYGTSYLDNGKKYNIILYLIFVSLAMLSKIPAGIYLAVLVPLFFYYKDYSRKIVIAVFTVIPLILTFIWYFVWNPYLSSKYGLWYNSGKDISSGIIDIASNIGFTLEKFYFSAFSSYILFAVFIVGIVFTFLKQNKNLMFVFFIVSVTFLIYVFKSGFYFYHHNYYIIPFVPIMAIVAGYAISLIKKRWIMLTILTLGIIESIANQQHDFFSKSSEKYKLKLETIADSVSLKQDLIVINGNSNPQQLYLTHRKGWICDDKQLKDSTYLNEISNKGCKYIFVNKTSFNDRLDKLLIFENENYIVYKANN